VTYVAASGGTSDGQVGAQQGSQRATALRPRRLVGRDREIAEVIERVALTPLTTVTGPGGVGKTRLAELDDELDDAAVHRDADRLAQRSAEPDALIAELKRATGLGGRPRRSGSAAEKARLNVTRTIHHAITDLSAKVPDLAAHLDESIVTGVSCCYEPRANIVWTT
jgi:hypothetical protein